MPAGCGRGGVIPGLTWALLSAVWDAGGTFYGHQPLADWPARCNTPRRSGAGWLVSAGRRVAGWYQSRLNYYGAADLLSVPIASKPQHSGAKGRVVTLLVAAAVSIAGGVKDFVNRLPTC